MDEVDFTKYKVFLRLTKKYIQECRVNFVNLKKNALRMLMYLSLNYSTKIYCGKINFAIF